MFEQKEYMLAYALTFAFVILGMLVVCVPRPRKSEFVDKEQAAKDKKLSKQKKAKAKAKKKANKLKKKKLKAKKARKK